MKRRTFLATSMAVASTALIRRSNAQQKGKTILLAHGAWSAAWAWKKMRPLMSSAGFQFIAPTYTGLGDREHLANQSITLDTHIDDLLSVIKYEDLRDFVLLAHSYGGMVATGVADRVPERISKLIYLDAFVPRDGQALVDLLPQAARTRMEESVKSGDGWRVPPNPTPPDTSAEDQKWIQPRRVPTPFKCFTTPVHLRNGDTKLPRSYIYCKRTTPDDTFGQFAARAKKEGWTYREIDASHSPNVTAPDALSKLLFALA